MLRKSFLSLLIMLTLPNFASAYNCWSVTKSSTPTANVVSIVAPSGAGITQAGNTTTVTAATSAACTTALQSLVFDVQAPAGATIMANGIKVDGVAVGSAAASYTINRGTKVSHTIAVAYNTTSSYTITTTTAAGGSISSSTTAAAGSTKTVSILPNAGYAINTITVDSIDLSGQALIDAKAAQGVTFTAIAASHTVSATFAVVPTATAVISTPSQTVLVGATVTIDGSGSSTNGYAPQIATYNWSSNVTGIAGGKATFVAGATGAQTVTLTVTGTNGVTSSAATMTITVQSLESYQTNACISCHNTIDLPVGGVVTPYNASAHKTNEVGCRGCHGENNHGPLPTVNVCTTCHTTATPTIVTSWQAGAHGAAADHTTGTCQRCHASEGAIAGANAGWTGSYANVLVPYSSTVWRNSKPAASSNGINCAVCHDPHNGLRAVNTIVGGVKVAWDPNQNGSNDQFDVCTSCHSLLDNTGATTDMYHEKSSINVTRMLADSHYDNPATGVGLASNVVEGYAIRAKGANPCADCHNLHAADLTVQEAWAKSAHAGKIATKKADAACAESVVWFNGLFPANTATDCTDSKTEIVPPSTSSNTRTVFEFFQRNPAGVAFYKTVGALDDAEGNAWTHYDWDKTQKADGTADRGDCQRCHTSTGLANFLTAKINSTVYSANNNDFSHLSGWGIKTGSPQQELLYCWGCHSDSQTGALRNPGAITEVYSGTPTVTVAYPNVDKSNVCMACHLGRETGAIVKASTLDFSNLSFINSHYLAAGSTIFNESGYEYDGQSYDSFGYHKNVGVADAYSTGTAGPCVTCHMTSAEGHSFDVFTKDATGAITAVASTQCVNCHAGLTPAALEGSKHEFHLAMEELKTALGAKGIVFYPAHPYFYKDLNANGVYDAATESGSGNAFKNWNAVYPGKGKDVMGAAFNYNLFEHDPGAYAHNRGYALKLIQDSIDFLADGAVDGAGVPAAFTAAAGNKEFAETTSHPAAIVAAPGSTNCGACHQQAPHYDGFAAYATGGTWSGTAWSGTTGVLGKAQYAFVGVTCAECHTAGNTTANGPILVQYAESGHGNVAGDAWIHYNWKWTAATADVVGSSDRKGCARCHTSTGFKAALSSNPPPFAANNGDAANPAEVLSCGACHSDLGDGSLRNPGAVATAATGYPVVTVKVPNAEIPPVMVGVVLPDAGKSNGCNYCHSGAGNMYTAWSASRIASHHAVAAGTLYGTTTRIGYEFQAVDTNPVVIGTDYLDYSIPAYIASDKHAQIGMEPGGTGACVGCHMPSKDHRFEVVDTAAQTIRSQTLCNSCHTVGSAYEMTYVKLEEEKAGYEAAGALLAAFIGNAPQNYKNAAVTGSVTSNNDRAAWYNSKLFPTEEKGAFAHNRFYVKRLMFDSIDWLQDGVLNGTLTTGTAVTEINPTTYATALAWLGTARP